MGCEKISGEDFFELLMAYDSSEAEVKARFLDEISSINANQLSFVDWAGAFYDTVADDILRNILAQKVFEAASDFGELSSAYFVAYELGLEDKKVEFLKKILELDDASDDEIQQWIDAYADPSYDLMETAYLVIIKNPTLNRLLDFCQLENVKDCHLEHSLQVLYELDITFGQWLDLSLNDFYKDCLKSLFFKAISEKDCDFDDLVYAYDRSEYYPEQRSIIFQRFSTVESTKQQWRKLFELSSEFDELGQFAESELADIEREESYRGCTDDCCEEMEAFGAVEEE